MKTNRLFFIISVVLAIFIIVLIYKVGNTDINNDEENEAKGIELPYDLGLNPLETDIETFKASVKYGELKMSRAFLDYTHRTYSKKLIENGNIYATYFYKYKVDLELSELIQDLSENVLSPQDLRDMQNDIEKDLENFSLKMIRIDWIKQSYQYRIKEILFWIDILGQPNEIYFLTNESSATNFIRFLWIFRNYKIFISIPEFEDKGNSPFNLKIYYPQFADEAEKMNLYTLRKKYLSDNIQIEEQDLNDSFQEKLDEML